LSLSYAATQQEVNTSVAANFIKWKVEVSQGAGDSTVSGELKIAYPWDRIYVVQNKPFKLGQLANAPPGQYTHSESFAVLAPGTIHVKASWAPKAQVSASLAQNTVGAVAQQTTDGPFVVTHQVTEQNLAVSLGWTCAFQNLSQQELLGTVSISFVPDR
jgi:hypothetical protein